MDCGITSSLRPVIVNLFLFVPWSCGGSQYCNRNEGAPLDQGAGDPAVLFEK